MGKIIATKEFPASTIGLVTASGTALNARKKGITVNLWAPDENSNPTGAEVFATDSDTDDYYAEIGLVIEDKALVDYDGVFECPAEVLDMLKERGIDVSECVV